MNYIQNGMIYCHVNTINFYKRPVDQIFATFGTGYYPRTRSVLMNCWLSPYPGNPSTPAMRHGNAGGLSFADGHSEIKRWTDKYVLHPPTADEPGFASDPASGDNAWLEQRESVLQ
jgi:prepilin-type processing-associated H-X9-DG protein